MAILSDIFTLLVAIEALFILVLEMFGHQTALAQKAFDLPKSYLVQKEAQVSMANQGLYNGFIGVGILAVRFLFPEDAIFPGLILFIGFVVIAAVYGAMTANKKILLTQGLPAILAFILLLLTHS